MNEKTAGKSGGVVPVTVGPRFVAAPPYHVDRARAGQARQWVVENLM